MQIIAFCFLFTFDTASQLVYAHSRVLPCYPDFTPPYHGHPAQGGDALADG